MGGRARGRAEAHACTSWTSLAGHLMLMLNLNQHADWRFPPWRQCRPRQAGNRWYASTALAACECICPHLRPPAPTCAPASTACLPACLPPPACQQEAQPWTRSLWAVLGAPKQAKQPGGRTCHRCGPGLQLLWCEPASVAAQLCLPMPSWHLLSHTLLSRLLAHCLVSSTACRHGCHFFLPCRREGLPCMV